MSGPRNILWIMCDQLRFDYLGCYGHPTIRTPNIDALARRGVRFTHAYVQSPVCGPARMSFYTGRYMRSHGSNWNQYPLRVGEPTLGEHLEALGVHPVLVGKTHMRADTAGMARLGIDPATDLGLRIAQCGFEPFDRDDGLHPGTAHERPAYNEYLRGLGFSGDNPWHDWANAAEGPNGEILSGWLLEHADKAARVPEEHSETPYMTRRAMEFIRERRAGWSSLVSAPFLHQAALALHRACSVSRNVRAHRYCPASALTKPSVPIRTPFITPSWSSGPHATSAATRCASA